MIQFKQKSYGKVGAAVNKAFKENPVATTVSLASLGISSTNMAINARRKKTDREYQDKQINATNKLTAAITKNNEIAERTLDNNNLTRKQKTSLKKFKLFSIESGGFRKGKLQSSPITELDIEGLDIFSRIDLRKLLLNLVDGSVYRVPADRELLEVSPTNKNPKDYVINLLIKDNVLGMCVINPNKDELSILNKVLDSYCKRYDGADYSSELIPDNIYLITVNIIGGSNIVQDLNTAGLRLNILK